jgi:preprotein translocase subunit SecA
MNTTDQKARFGKVANVPGRFRRLTDKWRGRHVEYDLSPWLPRLQDINGREDELKKLPDRRLGEMTRTLRDSAREGVSPDDLLCETYALVRESARRVLGMRHYDVQIVGGMVLHEAKLVEMETGEGKTLVAVLPAVLNSLDGRGVHVLTFNDYLAKRDAGWMGPVYEFLGLGVSHVEAGMTPEDRRRAYQADVTYLTAKEAGFDYLRDGLCTEAGQRVHRDFHFAIVDEADSILIDEARIPLVIAGSREPEPRNATRLAAVTRELVAGSDYETDEARRNVFLTDQGTRKVERLLGIDNLHAAGNEPWLTGVNLALHARELLCRDVDYIVRDGAIELVDEFTGRVVTDRHWPDGLQAAIEAKEGLRFGREGEVLGSITLQHFFSLYQKLSGMTATARPEQEELREFYGLGVAVLPPNRPCIRRDLPDRIFTHREAKMGALVGAITRAHQDGRPVLVGTASVRESEELAGRLRATGLGCEVLNAKTDELEARIIAEAGAPGALTISTNMAGRGTDIRLGGADENRRDEVMAKGGLYVIGTNRHESRRIDRQLRGRAGRQGDPGSSEFFISLEDDLIERYGVDDLLPERRRKRQDEPVHHPLVRHRIDWAQRVIEGQNFDIRRTLWNYSSFVEDQRSLVRKLRDDLVLERNPPVRWSRARPERHEQLISRFGSQRAATLECRISLHVIDRLWTEYLATVADLREGIHMVRLGNMEPVVEFQKQADKAFRSFLARIDEEIVEFFDRLELEEEGLDIERLGIRGPSSTWTYLVNDNPFRSGLGLLVSGNLALSLGAALHYPLYIAGVLYQRYFKKKR